MKNGSTKDLLRIATLTMAWESTDAVQYQGDRRRELLPELERTEALLFA